MAHLFRLTGLFLFALGISFASIAQDDDSSFTEPIFSAQPYSCYYEGQNFENFPSAEACMSEMVSLMPDGHLYDFSFGHYEYGSKRRTTRFYFYYKESGQQTSFSYGVSNPIICPSGYALIVNPLFSQQASGHSCKKVLIPAPEDPDDNKCEAGEQYTFSGNSRNNYPESQCIDGCFAKPSAKIPSIGLSDRNGEYTYTWFYTTNGEACELPPPPIGDKPPSPGGGSGGGSGACLTDKTISFPRFTLVLPFSLLCPWFDILGNVIVALASLIGARIITRV